MWDRLRDDAGRIHVAGAGEEPRSRGGSGPAARTMAIPGGSEIDAVLMMWGRGAIVVVMRDGCVVASRDGGGAGAHIATADEIAPDTVTTPRNRRRPAIDDATTPSWRRSTGRDGSAPAAAPVLALAHASGILAAQLYGG